MLTYHQEMHPATAEMATGNGWPLLLSIHFGRFLLLSPLVLVSCTPPGPVPTRQAQASQPVQLFLASNQDAFSTDAVPLNTDSVTQVKEFVGVAPEQWPTMLVQEKMRNIAIRFRPMVFPDPPDKLEEITVTPEERERRLSERARVNHETRVVIMPPADASRHRIDANSGPRPDARVERRTEPAIAQEVDSQVQSGDATEIIQRTRVMTEAEHRESLRNARDTRTSIESEIHDVTNPRQVNHHARPIQAVDPYPISVRPNSRTVNHEPVPSPGR